MNPLEPKPGDTGHAACSTCGFVDTTYALTDVVLGGGDAFLRNACAGLCNQCKAPTALSPGFTGELVIVTPDNPDSKHPRLSKRASEDLHRLESQGWPRLAVSPSKSLQDMRLKAYSIATTLVEQMQKEQARTGSTGALQHSLDDALDLLDDIQKLEAGLPLDGVPLDESCAR